VPRARCNGIDQRKEANDRTSLLEPRRETWLPVDGS
jgi:hypothetical protein